MIPAATFIEAARERGFALYTGVPCSYLKPLINSSSEGVMFPIISCWGSSGAPPGSPRSVTINRIGKRKVSVREVNGLDDVVAAGSFG